MAAIKRDLIVGNFVLAQPGRDRLNDFGGDVLVRASIDEGHPHGAQSIGDGVEREIEIGRKLAAPQRDTIDLRLPQGRPAADSGSALGIPQGVHCHTCAIEGPEHLRVHGIEVPHVVLDLGEPILSRHPACANASLRRTLAQIEPGQPLRRDEITMPIVEHAQLLQESRPELAVPMTRKPDLPNPPRTVAQGEVACAASHSDVVLLHLPRPQCGMWNAESTSTRQFRIPNSAFRIYVTKMVTTSCGSATNRTVLPRPSSTRATDSRSSARTRWALFTLSPNRHAPAVFRPVAL